MSLLGHVAADPGLMLLLRVSFEGGDPAGARLAASRTPALARAGAALASEFERTITTNRRETR